MYLIINTSKDSEMDLILVKSKTDFQLINLPAYRRQSEKLLSAIDDFMKINKVKLKQIKGIGVVTGPGGFTSVRIGVVCANTLAYALNIPVFGLRADQFKTESQLVAKVFTGLEKKRGFGALVLPYYDREPNITKKST